MHDLSPSSRVRATAQLVSSNAKLVRIDETACKQAATFLHKVLNERGTSSVSISRNWCSANNLHPARPSPQALKWIFVVDTLNFCLWTPEGCPPYTVLYKGHSYTGYWALCAAINRALDEGIAITDCRFFANVHPQLMAYIFRSSTSTPIPLFDQRVAVLREAGSVLVEHFDGSVENLVLSCNGNAQQLIHTVVTNFKSFDDSLPADAFGKSDPRLCRLYFYKRAQILVADIWACFAQSDLYNFHDICSLTMFADYRVPQILAWLGALQYSDELMTAMRNHTEFERGCLEEIEIRACSIHAVELIRLKLEQMRVKDMEAMKANNSNLNSVMIDFALWDYAKQHKETLAHIPIHHVKSVFY